MRSWQENKITFSEGETIAAIVAAAVPAYLAARRPTAMDPVRALHAD